MPLRHQDAELVAEFLARGGPIRKMPEPEPPAPADVLEYLQDCNVDVHAVVKPGERVCKYVYKGVEITEKKLYAFANRHRRRRRLPPFELPNDVH